MEAEGQRNSCALVLALPALLSLPRGGQTHNIYAARACWLHSFQGQEALGNALWVNTASGSVRCDCLLGTGMWQHGHGRCDSKGPAAHGSSSNSLLCLGMGWSRCGRAPGPSCTLLNLLWATSALVLLDLCKDNPKGFSFFLACIP